MDYVDDYDLKAHKISLTAKSSRPTQWLKRQNILDFFIKYNFYCFISANDITIKSFRKYINE